MNSKNTNFNIIILVGLIFLTIIFLGYKGGISLNEYQTTSNLKNSIIQMRVSEWLVAIFCGAGLSICGLFLQTVFQNPLASPYILGVSGMSSLFVALVILSSQAIVWSGLHQWLFVVQILFSILGAGLVLFIIYQVQKKNNISSVVILVGILLGMFASALEQMLELFMNGEELKSNFLWNLGSMEVFDIAQILLLIITVTIAVTLFYSKAIDANKFLLGTIYAINQGLDISKFQRHIFILSAVLIAVITAICGPIGFIGLMAPHIARMLHRSQDHKRLFFSTLLLGSGLALLFETLSFCPCWDFVVPFNVIGSLVGVPFALFILIKSLHRG